MITLIPYKQLVFHTSLTVIEAYQLAAREILRPSWGFSLFVGDIGGFEGWANHDGFKAWKRIKYRNSFLPIAVGVFHQSPQGTDVEVTIRPSFLTMMIFPFVFAPCLVSYATNGTFSLGLVVLSLLYIFVIVCFNPEYGSTVRFIQTLYDPYKITLSS